MNKFSLKEILSLSLDIGERMLKCGAEVSRVEETIDIICKNYGILYREVFVMNSLIVVTLRKDDNSVTESRRITGIDKDLNQLEKLNSLSRKICKDNMSRKEVLKCINSYKKEINNKYRCIGQLLAAFSFTMFFGGNFYDAISSLIIALIIFILEYFISKKEINYLVRNFFYSFVIGFIAILLYKINISSNYDKVMIGDIMLLIPGLSMFTSINDIFKGDTMSGASRFIEGLCLAFVIAGGIGLALLMLGGIL